MTNKQSTVICPLARDGKCPKPLEACSCREAHVKTEHSCWPMRHWHICDAGPCEPVETDTLEKQHDDWLKAQGEIISEPEEPIEPQEQGLTDDEIAGAAIVSWEALAEHEKFSFRRVAQEAFRAGLAEKDAAVKAERERIIGIVRGGDTKPLSSEEMFLVYPDEMAEIEKGCPPAELTGRWGAVCE